MSEVPTRYEARDSDMEYYRGRRAYVWDLENKNYVAAFYRCETYPDPLIAAQEEAARLNEKWDQLESGAFI